MLLGPLRPTYSKYAQHPEHKRKENPLPPVPEPKRVETSGVPTVRETPIDYVPPIHEIRMESNNDVINNETPPLYNPMPAHPPIPDKYLLLVIGCAILYLWRTHGPQISMT